MFLFKKESRNALNLERQNPKFVKEIKKLFGFRLVHLDLADQILRVLDEEVLEKLNQKLIHILLEKKVFHSQRLFGKYFLVAVDGSHVMNVPEGHCEGCLHRTSKSGKKTYFHNVLEAKIVTANGFAISLASEWLQNDGKSYFDKQDSEQKALIRLALKIKNEFPQVAFCILADGLYPNATVFELCESYHWQWIITLKDGNLKSLWEEVLGLEKLREIQKRMEVQRTESLERHYKWYNGFIYQGMPLYWFECQEITKTESKRFAYVSSIQVDYQIVLELTEAGRLRWRIENNGFLNLKQRGYAMSHRYSRVSMLATKNYYRLMQIAHLMNQLFELQQTLQKYLKEDRMSLKHLMIEILTPIRAGFIESQVLEEFLKQKIQIRFS